MCYFLEDVLAVGPTYNEIHGHNMRIVDYVLYDIAKCKLRNSIPRRLLHYIIHTFTVKTLFSCFFLLLHKMQ